MAACKSVEGKRPCPKGGQNRYGRCLGKCFQCGTHLLSNLLKSYCPICKKEADKKYD